MDLRDASDATMTETKSTKQERFVALFEPAQASLHRFVMAMTRDAERTKDIVGETILIAYERLDTLRNDGAFLSFLFTIATRVCNRRGRETRRQEPATEEELASLRHGGTPADVAADISMMYRALEQLPERQREAVLLFEVAGFSTEEIRGIQGGTLVAVRVRITRGRRKLAALLGVPDRHEHTHRSPRATSESSPINDVTFTAIPTEL